MSDMIQKLDTVLEKLGFTPARGGAAPGSIDLNDILNAALQQPTTDTAPSVPDQAPPAASPDVAPTPAKQESPPPVPEEVEAPRDGTVSLSLDDLRTLLVEAAGGTSGRKDTITKRLDAIESKLDSLITLLQGGATMGGETTQPPVTETAEQQSQQQGEPAAQAPEAPKLTPTSVSAESRQALRQVQQLFG